MIYIHIPFCNSKCNYCAFYSIPSRRKKDLFEPYIHAVCQELESRKFEHFGRSVRTIYIGGGTPSLLPVPLLEEIIKTLQTHYDLSALEEATIEANPEQLTPTYLNNLASLGFFNRISIGVQSFNDRELKKLGRTHNSKDAINAITKAHKAGFNNISADLIYGIPDQFSFQWSDTLDTMFSLPIQHLSCYSLTIEPGTVMEFNIEHDLLSLISESEELEMYEILLDKAARNGFHQYEISNFCKYGMQSRHNSRYWNRTPYMGIGASAHSFNGITRRWNIANVGEYINALHFGTKYHDEELLTEIQAFNEYIMTALRTTAGIDKQMLSKLFTSSNLIENQFRPAVEEQIRRGLLFESTTHIIPTHDGLLQADGIATKLMVEG